MLPTQAILVVDDCEDEVLMLLRSAKVVGLTTPVNCVDTVEDAICYLKGEGRFSDREKYPMASLVLLDFKLHARSGFDVLRWVRAQPELVGLIVVVMTSNEDPHVINLAYQLGANSFLVKPFTNDALNDMVRTLHHYWLTMNRT